MIDCQEYLFLGDCLDVMPALPPVDLVFGSPPYEAARTYGVGFKLRGQDWVDWMVARMIAMTKICRGLVAMVVEGQTRKFRWSATPALLMADLHRAGISLRKPPVFHRVGIPGSGGPDWLRNDYEFIVCCQGRAGKLPWSDNKAMGHAPKYPPGGAPSHRRTDGSRVSGAYNPPPLANPGNVVHCKVGGGLMGSRLVHGNEAGFPERLAEFFIRSFCPPGGCVCDPFCGSGTTLAVAERLGRQWIGIDIRESQIGLSCRRVAEVQSDPS